MNNALPKIKKLATAACWSTIIALVMACPVVVHAQGVLTLSQAINDAFANRKNIQAGKTNQKIRKLQTDALYRKYWPKVNAEYTYLYNPILQTSILPIGVFNPSYPADATKSIQFGTKWSQAAGLTVNQPIIDLSIREQINEAKLQERVSAAAQAQSEYDLAYLVAQVYLDISQQESKIKSAVADTNRTWLSYQFLLSTFEQKRLLKSELNKGKINHNNAVQAYRNAVSQIVADKVYLLFLTGKNTVAQTDITIDTSFMNKANILLMNAQPETGTIPELQQMQLQGDLVSMQTKSEKAKYLPTLSLKGFLGANQYTNNFDPIAANTWFGLSYVGIDLKYPLLFAEDKHKNIQQLQLQSTQYYQQRDDKTAQYQKDASIAKIKMEQLQAALKTQEENIALSLESIRIFQARVAEGQESATNLNTEEAELQKLDANYQTNKKQYWLYLLDYLKATGRLDTLWK